MTDFITHQLRSCQPSRLSKFNPLEPHPFPRKGWSSRKLPSLEVSKSAVRERFKLTLEAWKVDCWERLRTDGRTPELLYPVVSDRRETVKSPDPSIKRPS